MGQNIQESRELATLQQQLNQINQQTPFGSLTFSGDPTNRTATTTLPPELMRLFGLQTGNQQAAGQAAGQALGGMNFGGPVFGGKAGQFQAPNLGRGAQTGGNNPFNLLNMLPGGVNADTFGQQRDQVSQATFDRAMNLLRPEYARQDRRREQDLANRGLPMSGEAYQVDRSNTARSRGETLNQLALSSVLAGGQEQSRMLGDILGTSQTGIGQASANRAQQFGEALQGHGAGLASQNFNMQRNLMNRQQPMQEVLQLLGASSGMQQPQFFAPGQTPVQSFATSGQPGAGAGIGSMLGTLGGAGIGGLFGGLPGAMFGSGLGGGFGGAFGSLFG